MRAPHAILTATLLGICSGLVSMPGQALNLATSPMFTGTSVPPLVMLDISKDQQLFKKAYNDYSDLDGDGTPETTYKHAIDYYGYFDPYKCYTYSTTNNRFEPSSVSNTKKCSSKWSGNFLNWASMTRMDTVRKLLYGGTRSTDSSTDTVLERAYLPTDAHAFAKFYDGSGGAAISEVTPFTTTVTTPPNANSTSSVSVGTGDKTFSVTLSGVSIGDQIRVTKTTDSGVWMIGGVTSTGSGSITINVPDNSYAGSGSHNSWKVENISATGISVCNLTEGSTSGANRYSQTNTNPPMMRVAKGNFMLWSANERWQCYWSGEKSNLQSGFTGGFRSNGNRAGLSGLAASAENPSQSGHGLGSGSDTGEYYVRAQVCKSTLLGTEKCKAYPGGNYKPIGLLQYYGDSDLLKFGLMTGSYAKNISGGVLRKNVSSFSNEVNAGSSGTFVSGANGIVQNMDKLRIYGYDYDDGYYGSSSGDSCTYQQTGFVLSGGSEAQGQPANQGNCTSWGNPMSEVYYESLRYLAGQSATSAYTYTSSGSKDAALGLTLASWTDPISSANYCAPLNVVLFNASVSTDDNDLASTSLSSINSASTAAALTDTVGGGESVNGNSWFVGRNGSDNNEFCTAKTVSGLGSAAGLCPEGPTGLGSYLMAGLAHHARVNKIRTDLSVPADDEESLKVSTYGVQVATNVPKIEVTVNGNKVTILPAYRLSYGLGGGGALVDFKIVSQTATSGRFYLNWEDSEMGGDYDQDMWGILSYTVSGNTITVTTDAISRSTAHGQGFGYIISGTTKDGPHFHSGIYDFDFTDPTNVTVSPSGYTNASGGCDDCTFDDPATSVTYTVNANSGNSLKDPLWYAAKWGGFSESTGGNNLPDQTSEWDAKLTDGTPGSDGQPDNYFFASNPLGLEQALDRTFTSILQKAAASAVATSSVSLKTDSRVYQATFNANDWSGQIFSYTINSAGVIAGSPEWNSALKLATQVGSSTDTRAIITYGLQHNRGMPFTWTAINGQTDTTQRDLLNLNIGGTYDGRGADRVGYLRGQSQHEGQAASTFRRRAISKLGDIVNSNPIYVGPPSAGFSDVDYPGYASFATAHATRTPVVYVGANDGMLHAINVKVGAANVGKEMLAYVPSPVYANLSALTAQNYSHRYYVDGSPMVADAKVGNDWQTVLVSGLASGGKGYFALDVTDPDNDFSEANAEDLVMWEFTSNHDADLGYTYNVPARGAGTGQSRQIARMNNDKWAVIVGNGYNSTAGKAALFILFLDGGNNGSWTSGTDYIKRVAESSLGDNGLSTPTPVDTNGDGKADIIYAGDLKGNLWKFDVSSSDPGDWSVALSGNPLFVAKDGSNVRQPIVSPPEVTRHKEGGMLVLFGTGKYMENDDNNSAEPEFTQDQTYYGVWDRNGVSFNGTAVSGESIAGRSWLLAQSIANEYTAGTTVNGKVLEVGARVPSTNSMAWCASAATAACESGGTPTAYLGWRMDLPTQGERVMGTGYLINGLIFFNTYIPSNTPCAHGGDGWLMALDYNSGGLPSIQTFDTNNNGAIDVNQDMPVAGIKAGAAIGGATFVKLDRTSNKGVAILNKMGGEAVAPLVNFGPGSAGRITWHELVD